MTGGRKAARWGEESQESLKKPGSWLLAAAAGAESAARTPKRLGHVGGPTGIRRLDRAERLYLGDGVSEE